MQIRKPQIKSLLWKTVFSSVFLILMLLGTNVLTFADTPVWTYKGAKWYSMMETGNVMVGMPNGVAMLDGATGSPIWTRSDVGEIKEDEYTELSGTPLVCSPTIPAGRRENQVDRARRFDRQNRLADGKNARLHGQHLAGLSEGYARFSDD